MDGMKRRLGWREGWDEEKDGYRWGGGGDELILHYLIII